MLFKEIMVWLFITINKSLIYLIKGLTLSTFKNVSMETLKIIHNNATFYHVLICTDHAQHSSRERHTADNGADGFLLWVISSFLGDGCRGRWGTGKGDRDKDGGSHAKAQR